MKRRTNMTIWELFRKIWKYVLPYKWLVAATLALTLISSLFAQVNAIVLDRTVDAVNALVTAAEFAWSKAARILTIISVVLLGKEILTALISFAQKYFGMRMRWYRATWRRRSSKRCLHSGWPSIPPMETNPASSRPVSTGEWTA